MAEKEQITLLVKAQNGQTVHFRIKPTTRLDKLMGAYCQKTNQPIDTVRFLFDGEQLDRSATAGEIGLDDGDTIDCVVMQEGGAEAR
mmetsp:Transcript_16282/g.33018  ORF Transcript_16282/g.33018 Transcript_16282/m.33018 type:complete len:87 (+) Transcript_16282:175-435(+)